MKLTADLDCTGFMKYMPVSRSSPPVSKVDGEVYCSVCGSDGARMHYNCLTCSRCRVFFIRYAKSPSLPLICTKGNRCVISHGGGERCAACRFRRCLQNNMKVENVGITRRFPNQMTFLTKGMITKAMVKYHYSIVVNYGSNEMKMRAQYATVQMMQRWRRGLNLMPTKPAPGNLQLTLREMLQICRNTRVDFIDVDIEEPQEPEIYGWRHFRLVQAFIDFLQTSDCFVNIPFEDQEEVAQSNFVDFILFSMAFNKWEKNISHDEYIAIRKRCVLSGAPDNYGDKYKKIFLEMAVDLEPKLNVLRPDQYEFLLVKMIAMFSSTVGLRDEAHQAVNHAREAYSMGLGNYVQYAHPNLTPQQQISRIASLLEIVSLVKSTANRIAPFYSQCVIYNFGEMRGKLTYDLHLRSY